MGIAVNPDNTTIQERIPIFSLLLAYVISETGNVLTIVAVPWFVLQTTGSAAKTGLAGAAFTLPILISGLFGGALVDRVGFKRMSVIADIASGLTVALIPLLYHTVGLAFWQLLLLVFLGAILDMPGATARESLLPDLARIGGVPLERANSAFAAVLRIADLAGPAIAGLLIAAISASNVLWIDAATFAFSAIAITLLIPSSIVPQKTGSAFNLSNYLAETREGIQFIPKDRLILAMVANALVLNGLIGGALFTVVLPVYANQVFGSAVQLGVMSSAFGVGGLASIIAYGAVGHRLPRRTTFVTALLFVSLPLWLLVMTPGIVVSVAALAISGIAGGPLFVMTRTIYQERVPEAMRGRVFGAIRAFSEAARPLAILAAGLIIAGFGLTAMLAIIAAALLAASLSAIINPAFNEMDHPREPTAPDVITSPIEER